MTPQYSAHSWRNIALLLVELVFLGLVFKHHNGLELNSLSTCHWSISVPCAGGLMLFKASLQQMTIDKVTSAMHITLKISTNYSH